LKPPDGRLEALKSYGDNAVYTGQLCVMLGCYRLVGGDGRYASIHRRLADLLHAELARLEGLPLRSLPHVSWTFDTVPVLLALRLYDRHTGTDRSSAVIRKHLEWVRDEATDPATGLPWSRLNGASPEQPRGCELSWRIMLLAQLDRPYAQAVYAKYTQAFWMERGALAGFAEWPGGRKGFEDVDSGPIVNGIGGTATGFGLGTAIAMGDASRRDRLCMQLPLAPLVLLQERQRPNSVAREIPYDQAYVTGFLFGDACLFYSITWQDWGLAGSK
jgi:hypothetical protein